MMMMVLVSKQHEVTT